MTAIRVPTLRLLFWEATARCNLACIHCRRQDADVSTGELTTDQAKEMFDSAGRIVSSRPIIVFSGGEPLLRNDWEELAGYARRGGFPVALATNGTLIDNQMARRVVSAGFTRVAVSLDGPDASTHDEFRGMEGVFDKAVAGIEHLRRLGQPVQVNVTVTSHNESRLDAMYELVRRLDVEALHIFLLVPVGCGLDIAETHILSPRRYDEVLNWIYDHRGGQVELKATCAPQYYRIAARRGGKAVGSRGCLCGISVVFVSHSGVVYPCGYLPVDCGNVRDRPLDEIWSASKVFGELRDFDKLTGRCGACQYKGICGGCRARAFAATGDYLSEEPGCTYER